MRKCEYMIGDWVTCHQETWRWKATDYMLDDSTMCNVKPILLTDEVLKANGFVTDNNHTLTGSCIYHRLYGKYEDYKVTVRLLNGWIKIESFDDRWYTLLDLSIQPRYVHELQRALRLCGLNDLADNFKVGGAE